MKDDNKDSTEPYVTWVAPPAEPCECGASAPPVALKPRHGTADWWDDPSPFWQCPVCGRYRGGICDILYQGDDSKTDRDTASASEQDEKAGSADGPDASTSPLTSPRGSTLRWSIGAGGPVVAEADATGWRIIVRGTTHVTSNDTDDLCAALRQLANSDPSVARAAFGVVMNCNGSWEDEYTEHHGEDALSFEDWLERVSVEGLSTHIDEDGELYYAAE